MLSVLTAVNHHRLSLGVFIWSRRLRSVHPASFLPVVFLCICPLSVPCLCYSHTHGEYSEILYHSRVWGNKLLYPTQEHGPFCHIYTTEQHGESLENVASPMTEQKITLLHLKGALLSAPPTPHPHTQKHPRGFYTLIPLSQELG